MTRKIGVFLAVLITMFSFLCMVQAQTVEKRWKKTVTLPSAEVILDISGEWDVLVENYGQWSSYGSYPQKMNITQEGSSFVGTRMMDDPYNGKGSTVIRGELDKTGIKKVTVMTGMGPQDGKAEISDDGNKIIIDVYDRGKQTLTRK